MNPYTLQEKIEKGFKWFNVNINICSWSKKGDRVLYKLKLKRSTTAEKVRAHAPDVQARLKLPLFQVVQEGFDIYLVVSEYDVEYPRLPEILEDPSCGKALQKAKLPYFVGHDAMGRPAIVDLVCFPHLMLGGSSGSGKSVGLQAVIATIAYIKFPSKVNLILIDAGAGDLINFEGIPHLSCPVVRTCEAAYFALLAVKEEMERRIALEHTSQDEYKQLPRLVVAIDEFPALISGQDNKEVSRGIAAAISSLLQRGRHAKIHLVLAAQNPTFQNMKVDLGNITARIAFRCAKKNFSETIIGEGGAENLLGAGSLLLKSPQDSGTKWIQGIYIKPRELQQLVQEIKGSEHPQISVPDKFEITIPDYGTVESSDTIGTPLSCQVTKKGPSRADQLLAGVILWVLEQDSISINGVMKNYHLGWNKAARLVGCLEELGIVGRLEGKVPREVVPDYPEDIPQEMIDFLQEAGYSQDDVINAFCNRMEK